MDDNELRGLENADTWDSDSEKLHLPVRNPRAVVSVAFSREDFSRVAQQAQQQGKKISAFIRDAALDAVGRAARAQVLSVSVTSEQHVHISDDFTVGAPVRIEVGTERTART